LFGVSKIREDKVQIVGKFRVTDKAYLSWVRVFLEELQDLTLIKPHVKCTKAGTELYLKCVIRFECLTYGSFTTIALAKFVKVNEELSNTDSVFGSEGL